MATCRQCGLPLKFVKKAGRDGVMRYWPVNPDGSFHWDLCKKTSRARDGVTREMDAIRHPPASTKAKACVTHVYCGDVPPWDPSLGPPRNFTAEEKAEGKICRPLR